jgi:mRNA-degrading endonuclease toxin of MazEF toxin-antitoxin module
LLIDQNHADWLSSGLHRASAVNCSSIGYLKKQHIIRIIGSLSAATMQEIDECLKSALGIS